ncbi:MAG: hypothetical protein AAGA54_25120 [Myxococcota bacterium]
MRHVLLLCLGAVLACTNTSAESESSDASTSAPSGDASTGGSSGAAVSTGQTSSAASSSSGTGFVEPDGVGLGSQCDIFEQDCLEGLKCTLRFGMGFELESACVEVMGTATVGDSCEHEGFSTGNDTCDETSACIGIINPAAGWSGTCKATCIGDIGEPTCAEAGFVCAGPRLPVCLQRCDPLLQDCVGSGEGCYFNRDTEKFQCLALAEELVGPGDVCAFGVACSPGLLCWEGELQPGCTSSACCTEYCDVDEPNTCALAEEGVECVALGSSQLEFESVGICVLP